MTAIAFVTGGSGFVGRKLIAALVARGDDVRALARSATAIQTVEAAGATAVRGELGDTAAMIAGMAGTSIVYHAAAQTDFKASREQFYTVTVEGTEHVLAAARAAGVRRVVHVSTEAVLADGKPIVHADETRPRPARPAGLYPWSKGLAEERVLAANDRALETVIVRPRFVWGPGDTSLLPGIIEQVRAGRFRWIAGGHYATSTCHVANAIEGVLLAGERGRPGEIYFLTDGEPTELRSFVTALLATRGVDAGSRGVPRWIVRVLAKVSRMVDPAELALFGVEVTVDDGKARRELGYVGRISRDQGLAELRASSN